jgi:hypothetical protein
VERRGVKGADHCKLHALQVYMPASFLVSSQPAAGRSRLPVGVPCSVEVFL